jgi:hypothetical protein
MGILGQRHLNGPIAALLAPEPRHDVSEAAVRAVLHGEQAERQEGRAAAALHLQPGVDEHMERILKNGIWQTGHAAYDSNRRERIKNISSGTPVTGGQAREPAL